MIAKLKREKMFKEKKRLYMNHSHKNTQLIEERTMKRVYVKLTLSLFKEAR